MNRERLDAIYELLDCSSAKIARAADYSPSEITRVRNGTRKYDPSSKPVLRLAEGIYNYADTIGAVKLLSTVCGSGALERKDLVPALVTWLFDPNPPEINQSLNIMAENLHTLRKTHRRSFGEKLSDVMDLLGVSNMRLASQMNVDPSTVRRFRSGLRSPKPPMDQRLAALLMDRALLQHDEQKLAKFCGIPEEDISSETLLAWFFENISGGSVSAFSGVDTLLESIEQFPWQIPQTLSVPVGAVDIDAGGSSVYWGTNGLRDAVIRFLNSAVHDGGELLLYSDQNMRWMVGDPEFQTKWKALMASCVMSGVRISIIHNTDRDISEMLSAIQSWLPLYMSGMIKPYICRLGTDERFSKTMFLRPGGACILSSCLRGNEDNGRYEYLTDRPTLDNAAAEFNALLSNCVPLIDIYREPESVPTDIFRSGFDTRFLLPGLSLATIPAAALDHILDRCGISGEARKRTESAHELQSKRLRKLLKAGRVREFMTLPSDETLSGGTAGVCTIDPHSGKPAAYTPGEFAAHAKAVIDLMDSDANYEVVLMPEQPFANIQIAANDERVSVMRVEKPYVSFVFSDKRLVRAFSRYFDILAAHCSCDREEIRKKLSHFL